MRKKSDLIITLKNKERVKFKNKQFNLVYNKFILKLLFLNIAIII